jgi:ATP-dependent DNA helicase RecG
VHPEYRRLTHEAAPLEETLTPVYPLTEGVPQGRLRALVAEALRELERAPLRDFIPKEAPLPARLPPLGAALEYLHRPPREAQLAELATGRHPAQQRLPEAPGASPAPLRRRTLKADPASRHRRGAARAALAALPFLTRVARRCAMPTPTSRGHAHGRLPQGDVGCGKTVVAAAAARPPRAAACRRRRWRPSSCSPSSTGATCATGSSRWTRRRRCCPVRSPRAPAGASARSDRLRRAVRIVVARTPFQEGIEFKNLALFIVDEQHRFGVQQRLKLQEKGQRQGRVPHQLIMTATPIPRTLAMTAYADLDISVIDELPPGRTPVHTVVVPEQRRAEVVLRIVEACRAGRQAYWVCPLIDESEELRAQAAEETAATLTAALPGVRVGLVHGRMPAAAKDAAMLASRPARSSCWSPPPSSRWGRTCPTPPSWGSRMPSAWDWRSCTSCVAASAAARRRAPACCCTARRSRRWRASGSR